MSEKTLEELIAAAEGRAPATETPPEGATPPAAAAPAAEPPPPQPAAPEPAAPPEGAPPPAAEPQPVPAQPDLSALPDDVRAMIERERARAAEFERAAKEADHRARQAAGQLQRLQREQRQRPPLARVTPTGVPSQPPTPAPAPQPATGGAPALPTTATAGHAAAASLLASDQWKRLLRDYPEFEEVGKGFTTLASELQSLRERLLSDDDNDPRARRLAALESRLAEITEQQERVRFASFEREHKPQEHVHVRIVREQDPETGETYRRHVVEPRSPMFAWFYYGLPADVRDGINWDDPEDLSALFTDMRESARQQGLLTPSATPAATPAAPTAPAAPTGPNPRVRVAAVPRAPNAGVTRVTSSQPLTPQAELAALIEAEDRRAAGT